MIDSDIFAPPDSVVEGWDVSLMYASPRMHRMALFAEKAAVWGAKQSPLLLIERLGLSCQVDDNLTYKEIEDFATGTIQSWVKGERDKELGGCIDCIKGADFAHSSVKEGLVERIMYKMRPEQMSLKQRALKALEEAEGADFPVVTTVLTSEQHALIRKALLALPDTDD